LCSDPITCTDHRCIELHQEKVERIDPFLDHDHLDPHLALFLDHLNALVVWFPCHQQMKESKQLCDRKERLVVEGAAAA
jgi:hypothetical protein